LLQYPFRVGELPPLPPGYPDATPRGELAMRVALAIRVHGWSEESCAETLGISLAQVRRLRNRARLIWRAILAGDLRRCPCGNLLPVGHRSDAFYCPERSTCRGTAARRGVRLRRSYRGRWTTGRAGSRRLPLDLLPMRFTQPSVQPS